MKKLLLLSLAICSVGCTPVLKTVYGIKRPRLEDRKSIAKYLAKRSIDTSGLYCFKDFMSFAIASQRNMINIPEAMFFNKDGYLVRYKKEAVECNAKVDDFINDLSHFSEIPPDKSINIQVFSDLLERHKDSIKPTDINVFITWTVYAGKLNKDKAFAWVDLLEKAKQKGMDVNVYLVNCDYLKTWNIPKVWQEQLKIKN